MATELEIAFWVSFVSSVSSLIELRNHRLRRPCIYHLREKKMVTASQSWAKFTRKLNLKKGYILNILKFQIFSPESWWFFTFLMANTMQGKTCTQMTETGRSGVQGQMEPCLKVWKIKKELRSGAMVGTLNRSTREACGWLAWHPPCTWRAPLSALELKEETGGEESKLKQTTQNNISAREGSTPILTVLFCFVCCC